MLVELILDFVPWPGRGGVGKRITDKIDAGSMLPQAPGAIKQALNERGWLGEEVVAAGVLRQGKEPSVLSMITGTALIELLRPRRSKSLPRQFVLAVTADRVVAFRAIAGADGEDGNGPFRLWIRPGERGSWPREVVQVLDVPQRGKSWAGTLVLDGLERVPVYRPNPDVDPSTDELLELLGSWAT
jgi:hypothetical protein